MATQSILRRIFPAVAVTCAAAGLAVPSSAAANDAVGPTSITNTTYDVAGMAQRIESRLGGVTGWSYAIAKDGRLAASNAGGKARIPADGNIDMTTSSRMEIWSATKTYTAAATLKLLEAHPTASLTSAVAPYLPAGWVRGTGFDADGVSFGQLLNHTSGLGQIGDNLTPAETANELWNTKWAGVQYAVQKGTIAPSSYNYTNMNYALLRVLNARLLRDIDPATPTQTASNTGTINLGYINSQFLIPAGIGTRSCTVADLGTATLHYNAANPGIGGSLVQLTGTNNEACAGHRGLQLSAMDMLRFMVYLRHGSIVSDNVRDQMDSGKFGWNRNSDNVDAKGVYWHGGDGYLGGDREGHTCHMKFPNNMEATLIIDSSLTGVGTTQCGVLLKAWQDA